MKKKIVMIGMMLCCTGCAVFQESPSGELNAAQISFERAVSSLVILRREGKFTKSEGEHLEGLMRSVEALLIQWEKIVFVENRKPEYHEFRKYYDQMFEELLSYLKEKEDGR